MTNATEYVQAIQEKLHQKDQGENRKKCFEPKEKMS